MEFVIIGIVSALNLLVIVHKFKKRRIEDGIFDAVLLALMASMFSGSYAGMVVAMVASLIISLYLWASPPTFFRDAMKHPEVQKSIRELKDLAKPSGNTKSKKSKLDEVHFD